MARHMLPNEPHLRAMLSRWRLPDGLDADDIIQEVYGKVAAMDAVDQIRNVQAYMVQVARTTMLMHIRRARIVSIRSVENLEQLAVADDMPSPHQIAYDRMQLYDLANAVSRLPEPGRSAFLMRVIDELPFKIIGERLGMSDNAVQKSVAKTLTRLATVIGRGGKSEARASDDQRNDSRKVPDERA